jgi:hypothetical protein
MKFAATFIMQRWFQNPGIVASKPDSGLPTTHS